jgi:anti-sigma regulatory factor (Ser/Thr protein kinase)
VQREPAALIDVLRAAQSEVEHYTRIEFGMIDRDIEVGAHAVNDMVHLVAELFDNATAFSPPNSTVLVEARRLGDSAILSVEDRGIGISREQLRDLNERLANPPMVDVAVSRMMGLVVVARLANRHSVSVELRPADTERGTVADVNLPIGVLVLHSAAGRLQPGSQQTFGNGGIQQQPAQSQRPAFGEPLALESGNGGLGGRPFDPNPPMPTGGMLGTNGRSVPAWSDLTGAPSNGFTPSNGTNGGLNGNGNNGNNGSSNGNGFRGPRSNEPIPPIPQSSGPQGFAGPDGLPQRRNGDSPAGDANGFAIPRQLPSNPEHQGRPPFVPPVSAPPSSPPPYGGGRPVSSPPVAGPPVSSPPMSPPVSGAPSSTAPAQPAPPAWPPVAADRNGSGAPAVPESLAASLDMTAEIPRYRPDRSNGSPARSNGTERPPTDADRSAAAAAAAHEAAAQQAAAAQATAAQQIAAAQAAARQRQSENGTQYADETMELPIFKELESAWFTTTNSPTSAPPATAPSSPAPVATATPSSVMPNEDLLTTQRFSTAEPTRPSTVPQQAGPSEAQDGNRLPSRNGSSLDRDRDTASVGAGVSSGSNGAAGGSNGSNPWQTAADEGWHAARAASEAPVETTTTAGLPKRTPMAQLVPGGVDRGGNSVQRRTPEAVRGLLSAYHRGVQRGRQTTSPEETSGGQQSSQAGKEHEA